ncbi:MAG: glycosyltransferase, partial [Candidatus Riflebacteria bacterium]|nr:glycosyltransferase [Candidatus Riflebacteria bacterium]
MILGLGHATGDLVLFQDADLELDPRLEYTRILEPILAGRATVVFGARDTWRVPGSRLTTRLANWFLNRLTRLLYGGAVTDLETAYKCMPARVLRSLAPESTGFEIEPEITAKLLLAGHRIHEVPVSYRPRTVAQGKKIGWIDGVIAVLTLLKYRLPWMWTPPSPPDGRPDRVALALVLILAGLLVAVFGLARARVLRSVDPPGRASG